MENVTMDAIKIGQAKAYISRYGDTQAARHAADQNGDMMDSRQWTAAGGSARS